MNEEIDALINIVDASNLERNLYFTLQLLELGKPTIMSLNMMDVADYHGVKIDTNKLQDKLGIPIVPMMVRKGRGLQDFINQMKEAKPASNQLKYSKDLEAVIGEIITELQRSSQLSKQNYRWLAIQLLEGNSVIRGQINDPAIIGIVDNIIRNFEDKVAAPVSQLIREERYSWIHSLLAEVMVAEGNQKKTFTERIDNLVTNKWLGIPIFLLFMYLTFQATFTWIGAPMQDLLDGWFSGPLTDGAVGFLTLIGATDWLINLVVDGIIAGVGGVLIFVPQIFVLFLIISFLEDSGYMARAAFIMDKAMSKMGLNGKAFIPMIVGFGCNVPGVMSTRTIEQPKERLVTILLSPFMSCSARLAVYALSKFNSFIFIYTGNHFSDLIRNNF